MSQPDGLPENTSTTRASAGLPATVEREIQRALAGIRYGSVEITIHEGRVVQIERREKVRLSPSAAPMPLGGTSVD